MSEQQRKTSRKKDESDEQIETDQIDTSHKDQLDDDVDAILDDIDAVLEENAEEFVRGFVQKGGQ
ncbi:MAG: ubiquitin-like protein Pup [Actinomycetales bacterium]|nr:ubiquitin-like protein Pup [Actinomycetales bacterium]